MVMKTYDYYLYDKKDAYGQLQISDNPVGKVKMCINITSQIIQDNINYSNAQYLGLTYDRNITDKCVIFMNHTKLKVLYVNPKGRMVQVFMSEI